VGHLGNTRLLLDKGALVQRSAQSPINPKDLCVLFGPFLLIFFNLCLFSFSLSLFPPPLMFCIGVKKEAVVKIPHQKLTELATTRVVEFSDATTSDMVTW